jgi:hypothetical protein
VKNQLRALYTFLRCPDFGVQQSDLKNQSRALYTYFDIGRFWCTAEFDAVKSPQPTCRVGSSFTLYSSDDTNIAARVKIYKHDKSIAWKSAQLLNVRAVLMKLGYDLREFELPVWRLSGQSPVG